MSLQQGIDGISSLWYNDPVVGNQAATNPTGDETMKATEIKAAITNATDSDSELWIRLEDADGVWLLVGAKSGWFHVEQDDEKRNVRANQIMTVVEMEQDELDDEDEEEASRNMSRTLDRYRALGHYQPSIGPNGSKSESNHDVVANWLEGREPAEVMMLAEQLLGLDRGFLMEKYGHLNRGQQRMNSGNRIRAALKRGELVVDEEGKIRTAQA